MNKYNFDLDLDTENSLALILKRIKVNSTILEFGPANGRMTKYLKEEMGCSVYAVELDKVAAKDAAKYSEHIIVGNIEDYTWLKQYKNIEFDYIVFADVLEHLYNPKKVLEIAKELLHLDGSIIFSIPNIAHNSIIMELLEDNFTYHAIGLLDNTHIRFFTKNSLDQLVSNIGLHTVYEDAIFQTPLNTEFHGDYTDYDTDISTFLKQRELGEVYQFIYELKRQDITLVSHLQKFQKFRLYYDSGDGFTNENSISVVFKNNKAIFDTSPIDNTIKKVKIILNSRAIKVQIASIKINHKEYENSIEHNGIDRDRSIHFLHNNPQIIIEFNLPINLNLVEITLKNYEIITKPYQETLELKEQQLHEKEQQLHEKEQQLHEKDKEIQRLHKLTQSMRIKNRLKKVLGIINDK